MGRNIEPPSDAISYIKALEKRIENLERSQRINNTAIDNGSVTVNNGAIVAVHPNSTELFRTGTGSTTLPFDTEPTEGYLTRIRRANNNVIFEAFSSSDGSEARFFMRDRYDNDVVAEDWLIGRGLGRPFIPWRFYRSSEWATPPEIVTSGTFVSVYTLVGNIQHPALFLKIRVAADVGTAGEIRVQDTFFSASLWSDTISAGFNDYKEPTFNLHGLRNYGDNCSIELQARRTAGTGNIRIGVELIHGRFAATL